KSRCRFSHGHLFMQPQRLFRQALNVPGSIVLVILLPFAVAFNGSPVALLDELLGLNARGLLGGKRRAVLWEGVAVSGVRAVVHNRRDFHTAIVGSGSSFVKMANRGRFVCTSLQEERGKSRGAHGRRQGAFADWDVMSTIIKLRQYL